uniref:Odorant-binding protein 12 n=1 Tax=Cyrtorhinus lividipennis TaxID=1032904 RepID=A0A346THZ4_9HEMI|nr:odorant-binding protein 12 [Cyrtorhinus lividipennis]
MSECRYLANGGLLMAFLIILGDHCLSQELPPPARVSNKTAVLKDTFLRAAKHCSNIYETSTVMVLATLLDEKSSDRTSKCFFQCMLQRYKLMDPNGSYNKNKLKTFLEYIPDSSFLTSIKNNLSACVKEKATENCEKAFKFIRCFYFKAKAENNMDTSLRGK